MERGVYDRMNRLEAQHWWYCARRSIIAALIRRELGSGTRHTILEAGCGSGGNLAMLQQFGHVDAFECDDLARQHATEKSGLDIRSGALPHELPFDGRTYDLIGLFDVLEHVEADSASLNALAKRLNANGKIIVTVPAYPFLWSMHDEQHHHLRRYTLGLLAKTARDAGLGISYSSYFNTFLFPFALVVRTAKRLTGSQVPDDKLPPAFINNLLAAVFGMERFLLGRFRLPAGLSLVAVMKRT